MDVDDVITLIEYIKDNDEEIYRELDRRFTRTNELLDEIFRLIWEIKDENKESSIKENDNKNEDMPFSK